MNVLELIKIGSSKLKQSNISSYLLDSEVLLSKVLKKKREEVLINLDQEINIERVLEFNNLISRRVLKEPIAYILKEKEFWSKLFEVKTDTLIPRPETELMVENLVKIYKKKSINILDIGTGSGCIIVSLLSELRNSYGTGIDISPKTLLIAKSNAVKHKVENRLKLSKKSLNYLFTRKFDLIVSNPPYIKRVNLKNLNDDIKYYEPIIALDGGNDGLDVLKKVIYKAKEILKINGRLAIEIGNEQYKKVSKILEKNNFRLEHNIKDCNENIRCIISTLNR